MGRAALVLGPMDLGALAPFRRPPSDAASYAARWHGTPPSWLRGSVVRTCPAVFSLPGWRSAHWFDGLGALFAFRLDAEPRLDWRLLECEAARLARRGRSRLATFGTRMRRPPWLRLLQPVPRLTDNANVNVQPLGPGLVAMTEAPRQALIDARTLAVKDWVRYEDRLGGVATTAHPVLDRERDVVVNMAQRFGARPECLVYQQRRGELRREVVGRLGLAELPYLHSFGVTPRHVVMIGHPLVVRPRAMLWSERGFIEHFRWRPERGTRLVVFDRAGGAPRTFETHACFVLHVVNAYEEGEDLVVDALAYRDAGVLEELRTERLGTAPLAKPDYARMRIARSGRVEVEQRLGHANAFEFPMVSAAHAGRRHRYCWGADPWLRAGGSALYKLDVERGEVRKAPLEGWIAGEPLFVPAPGAQAEDAGVLAAVASHAQRDAAALFILDAATLDILARAEVEVSLPLGFHGSFIN